MTAKAEERTFRIGEVAERAGVTTRTVRYYEERGLLGTAPGRAKGAHRLYTDADVARLQELVRLRDLLGLTLEDLVELAEAEEARAALRDRWATEPSHAERVGIVEAAIPLVQKQLDLVRARRKRLAEFERDLEEKLRSLEQRRAELGQPSSGSAR